MTVVERAASSPDTDPAADAAGPRPGTVKDRSRTAGWRVAGRLAYRQVRRTWVSSLLIMILIALPIAGMSAVAVYVDSMLATPAEKADVELGQMEAWVEPAGVPDSGFWQAPEFPWWTGYGTSNTGEIPDGEIPVDPLAALPAGTETVAVSTGQTRIETATGIAAVPAWAGPVWNPGFAGRFDVVEGRAPATANEVWVTTATLARTGSTIGGVLALADSEDELTIVGTFDAAELPDADSAVAFFDLERLGATRWYLPDLALSWTDVQALNEQGIVAYSREVVLDPPPFDLPDGSTMVDGATQQLYSMLALVGGLAAGGVAAGYMVVMLAGAAFAVSARRQQRSLAIAASVGADARDLRRTVRLQGTVLGLIAGLLGVAVGIGLAALVMRLVDNGSASMFWGFHVPWPLLVGILVFAVLVGTVSALMPARGVAKSDTISALRGARRPQKVTASRPLWGSLLILVGVAITIVCGIAAAAVTVNDDIAWDSPLRWMPTIGIIGGPILAQLGIVLSGRWLLWLASRALSKLGVAARIASRDAVANGARTVPAFAAIGATVFVGVFAVGLGTMATGQAARAWHYNAPVGTAIATLYGPGPERFTAEQAGQAAAAATNVLDEVGATATVTVDRQSPYWAETETDIPEDLVRATVLTPERSLLDPDSLDYWDYSELSDPTNNIAVIDADGIEVATGVRLDATQRAAYENGAALVTDAAMATDDTIEVGAWTEREWIFGGAPGNVFQPQAGDHPVAAPQWDRTLDAIVVDAPDQAVLIAIAPATAVSLDLDVLPRVVFGTIPGTATLDTIDRLQELSEGASTPEYSMSAWIETGPPGAEAWLVPLLAAIAVLVLGASAVALGLARFERRPDDATLSAVGGTTRLRRAIGFWQGLVIAGFGTFAGATAGILPPIGFWLQSQTAPQGPMELADIPWWLLLALAIGLPLVIALVNWIVPPRHPDLTRRTAIA
ncbi:FtsX-like permease family protein [Microbacterium invictum]|uniref:ABC3 transporter permease C-terminal domain-containing protein n=1 Tax=Microbacterium invictum TaxID=515415 RepID=A0AA40SSH9_9MICO|nr:MULTISPECIES: FtsX-like permease family protein [Microbacterium]MBB4141431.1 hypothetical protein [Microbacterium invictum]